LPIYLFFLLQYTDIKLSSTSAENCEAVDC